MESNKATSANAKKNKAAALPVVPRGKPSSGRLWKTVRTERHSTIKKIKGFRTSWEEKMEKKKAKDQFKEAKNKMKEERISARQLHRKRTEENKKKKAENQRKSEIVQVIKDTRKIKRMKKKQLRSIETR